MSTPSFLKRDFRLRLLAIVGILMVSNFLFHDLVVRVDLTRGKIYSLSPSSQTLVGKLERPLQIKAFFTRDLQPPYSEYERAVRDKLDEYQAFSKGMLTYDFKDPTGNDALVEEARRFGVQEAKIDFRSRDQREIKTAYMGLAFVYGDKQEVIPIVRNLQGLEYELTRTIKKLLAGGQKKTIAFLLGHGEPDLIKIPQQGQQNPLRSALDESYNVVAADMSQKVELPDQADALVVFAPMEEITPRHQLEIDQFLMAGKPVGFFLPSHFADMRKGQLLPLSAGLEPLLENYGVKLTGSLILDRKQNGRTQFPVKQGPLTFQAMINYPLHPVATQLNKQSIIVRDTESMVMPFTQALTLTDALKADKAMFATPLISSDETSRIKPEGELPPFDPQALADEAAATNEASGPFTMAYTVEGTFKSAFADKPLPNDDGTLDGRTLQKQSPATRMLVVGGAEFLRSSPDVFFNMMDWLAQDEDLISIRSRDEARGPLKVLEPGTQRAIAVANVVGLPLLFILMGLIRWRLRRRPQSFGEV